MCLWAWLCLWLRRSAWLVRLLGWSCSPGSCRAWWLRWQTVALPGQAALEWCSWILFCFSWSSVDLEVQLEETCWWTRQRVYLRAIEPRCRSPWARTSPWIVPASKEARTPAADAIPASSFVQLCVHHGLPANVAAAAAYHCASCSHQVVSLNTHLDYWTSTPRPTAHDCYAATPSSASSSSYDVEHSCFSYWSSAYCSRANFDSASSDIISSISKSSFGNNWIAKIIQAIIIRLGSAKEAFQPAIWRIASGPFGSVSASDVAFGAVRKHGFGGKLFVAATERLEAGRRYWQAKLRSFVWYFVYVHEWIAVDASLSWSFLLP